MAKKSRQRKLQGKRPPDTAEGKTAALAAATYKPWQIAAVCIVLAAATAFAFRGVRNNDFLTYDVQVGTMLVPQLRHKTGEIRVPAEAQAADYDLVVIASPTWWIQLSMPIRTYLESPSARAVLDGKPFATVSVSRRYYGFNLRQQRKLAEKNGGRFAEETHFVAAGGQVKSMLSWLGYMKLGEPQGRSMGLRLPPPNLKPDFEEQAKAFADRLVDNVLRPETAGTGA